MFSSALYYYTAELLSSCGCPSSVRRLSSVKPIFPEPVKQINAKFGGKVTLHHISRPFFFQKFAFLIFFTILFLLSLTLNHMEEKNSNDISFERF